MKDVKKMDIRSCPKTKPCRRAFTLIELLVVIIVAGLLLSLVIPGVLALRAGARREQCAEHMIRLGQGFESFEADKGQLPGYINDFDGQQLSWPVMMLPFVDQVTLWGIWTSSDIPVDDKEAAVVSTMNCPSNGPFPPGSLSYVANCGQWEPDAKLAIGGLFVKDPATEVVSTEQITDGRSQTLLLSENIQATVWSLSDMPTIESGDFIGDVGLVWLKKPGECNNPDNRPVVQLNHCRESELQGTVMNARPSSSHPGGAHGQFADGHVEFLSDTIELDVYLKMLTPSEEGVEL